MKFKQNFEKKSSQKRFEVETINAFWRAEISTLWQKYFTTFSFSNIVISLPWFIKMTLIYILHAFCKFCMCLLPCLFKIPLQYLDSYTCRWIRNTCKVKNPIEREIRWDLQNSSINNLNRTQVNWTLQFSLYDFFGQGTIFCAEIKLLDETIQLLEGLLRINLKNVPCDWKSNNTRANSSQVASISH